MAKETTSAFLNYLAHFTAEGESPQLPSLNDISKDLGVSISVLREQLEVAKALGLVDVRPRTGIRRQPYTFFPAVQTSLSYAVALSSDYFLSFADLRNRLEACYWENAVQNLSREDLNGLHCLVEKAWEKLRGSPIQIPHEEHRQFHLGFFRRLDNPFVLGILEAYWDAYEAVGLSVYTDFNYLHEVWQYHQQMVDALIEGDAAASYEALVAHKDLLYHRPAVDAKVQRPEDQIRESIPFE
jgi:DNA-binding FadR family transcriptional regulator